MSLKIQKGGRSDRQPPIPPLLAAQQELLGWGHASHLQVSPRVRLPVQSNRESKETVWGLAFLEDQKLSVQVESGTSQGAKRNPQGPSPEKHPRLPEPASLPGGGRSAPAVLKWGARGHDAGDDQCLSRPRIWISMFFCFFPRLGSLARPSDKLAVAFSSCTFPLEIANSQLLSSPQLHEGSPLNPLLSHTKLRVAQFRACSFFFFFSKPLQGGEPESAAVPSHLLVLLPPHLAQNRRRGRFFLATLFFRGKRNTVAASRSGRQLAS